MSNLIPIEVCYASTSEYCLLPVVLPEKALVREAIMASGVLARFPELVIEQLAVGIFSQKCSLDTPLKAGDRVEIYRPLTIDPKAARRLRAERNKKRGQ